MCSLCPSSILAILSTQEAAQETCKDYWKVRHGFVVSWMPGRSSLRLPQKDCRLALCVTHPVTSEEASRSRRGNTNTVCLLFQLQRFMGKAPLPQGKTTRVKLLCDDHGGWGRLRWDHRTHRGHRTGLSSSPLPGILGDSVLSQGAQPHNCGHVKTANSRLTL